MERRRFLKAATQTMAAVPAMAALGGLAEAQTAAKSATPAHTAAHKAAVAAPKGPQVSLNVKDLGATGDGKTKDTVALQLAIERCSNLGGGEVIVPAGEYLTGALALKSGVTLRIEEGATLQGTTDLVADYTLAQVRWEGHFIKGYIGFISATDATDIALVGKGKIIGNPTLRGRVERSTGLRYPALIEFVNCKNVRMEGLYTEQYGMWSTHPLFCENVTFKDVTFKSGADGIDVDSCKHTVIDGCTFDTVDDSISLKSGRGAEGNTIGRVCEDVLITNCTMSDRGFACIGIGSETSAGVKNVRIEKCKFVHARSHAIFIKSRVGRGAFVEDITATDLEVGDMGLGFLQINNESVGKDDGAASVPGLAGIPLFRNFKFSNVRVNDVPFLVDVTHIDPKKPLDELTLENITGTCKKGIELAYVKNAHLSGIKVTGFEGPLLATTHTTGTGLAGAVPLDESKLPKAPEMIPAPEKPFELK
ncbi:MAG TPA: glycoside hydrolase family 28 protein [Acidobacteriaceae bacterium]|nr:glycoside hydrolase family 28 protein [Acidobacteriaceae bacterium]